MIRKSYVDTADGQLHYRHIDCGNVPIVMFHMTSSSSESYEPLMNALAALNQSSIAFDTPNYGMSYKTDRQPTITYISSVMLEAVSKLGIDKFHVLGHHTGAVICVDLAITAPDRVLSTMLATYTYLTAEQNAQWYRNLVVDIPVTQYGAQLLWAWTRLVSLDTMPLPPDLLHRETIASLIPGENWNWAYKAVFTYGDSQSKALQVKCPMFLVVGEREPGKASCHDPMARDFPNAHELVVTGHGLFVLETAAKEVAPALISFINTQGRHGQGS